jgi:hypothetical protein
VKSQPKNSRSQPRVDRTQPHDILPSWGGELAQTALAITLIASVVGAVIATIRSLP